MFRSDRNDGRWKKKKLHKKTRQDGMEDNEELRNLSLFVSD